jgi:alpha-tubulin suppressor-like RCC1 family protein
MSSFNINRGVNNKVIKKNVNFTTTPKINNNALTLINPNLNLSALTLNGNTVTTSGNQLNYIDDATIGSATANKVVIPDNNLDISNINTITCNSLVINGNTITTSNANAVSESNSPYLQKIVTGKIQNSKAVVTDNSRNIETINKLSLNKLNILDNKIIASSNSLIKKKIYPLTWTVNSTTFANNITSVCWADELGLAVAITSTGTGNRVLTSPDGITWTNRTTPVDSNWSSVCWAPEISKFVAVASSPYGDYGSMTANSSNGLVASSSSNTSGWEAWNAFDTSISTGWHSTDAPTRYTSATGVYSGAITTTDSSSTVHSGEWIQLQAGSAFLLTEFTITPRQQFGNERSPRSFVILGSNNGSTWNLLFTETNKNNWPSDNGSAVTFNITNPTTSYSYYRMVVKRVGNLDSGMSSATSVQIINIEFNPEPFFSNIMYSSNGIDWTAVNPNIKSNWTSICWSPTLSLFTAVGTTKSHRIMTSPDGINWTARIAINQNAWQSVCWSPQLGLFVAVSNTGTSNRVMTSVNGITWIGRSSSIDNNWSSICWAPNINLFIAVSTSGTDNRIVTSPDSINWTTRFSPVNNNWLSITYSKELNLLVAVASSGTNRIMFSENGIEWYISSYISSLNLDSIVWAPGLQKFIISSSISPTESSIINSKTFNENISIINSGKSYFNINNSSTKFINKTVGNTYDFTTYSSIWVKELNTFVIGGGSGNIILSSDSNVWTRYTTEISTIIQSIAWSPQLNLLVAISPSTTNNVLTSIDGKHWMLRSSPTINSNTWQSVCWSPELLLFVAVGNGIDNRKVMTSTDGITWTLRTGVSNSWKSICWSSELGLFVAIGEINNTTNIMYSSDGNNWLARNSIIGTPSSTTFTSICWSPELSLFAAVSSDRVVISKDGINWNYKSVNNNSWQSICWAKGLGLFLAVGTSNSDTLMISLDGNNWKTITSTDSSNGCRTICWSDELNTFVASANNKIITLNNFQYNEFSLNSNNNLTNLSNYNNDNENNLYDNWYNANSGINNEWTSICYSADLALLAAVSKTGSGNRVMTSYNGTTWTSRTSTSDNNWTSICWSSELDLFVAVASSGTGDRVMTSANGIAWTSRTSAVDNDWTSVCWSPELNLFVAVASSGTGNRVMTSSNGISWTNRTSAVDNNWTSVCWSPELNLFVAVASSGTGNRVMSSSNGISWTSRTSAIDNNWTSVCWSYYYGLFVAVASSGTNNRTMISYDGINWSTSITYKPNQITSISMNSISACNNTSFAIISDNTMRAWGDNSNTKLGNTGSTSHTLPFLPGSIKTASNFWNNTIKVLANNNITVALLSNGNIQTRGLNTNGELGIANSIGTKGNSYSDVVDVTSITNATDIAIGEMHILALLSDGTIKAWGTNINGQLGDGSNTLRETPVTISSLSNVVAISTKNGGYHSLALLSNGTVKSWGLNTNGQLGNNSTTQENSPVTVNNLSNVIAISAGANHSLALLNNGTIMAWGLNTSGQLGDNSITQRNEPVLVSGITTAVAISAGYTHSLALLSDGTIRSWGSNNNGQLGNGSNNNSLTPVSVSIISSAVAISAGNEYSLALLSNSRMMSWGYNNVGQLGNNLITSRNTPGFVQFDATTTNVLHSIKLNILNTTSYANNNWTSICWSDEMKVFVAIANSGSNRIMISNNGITWYNKILSVNNNWTSICWSDLLSRFIGVSTDNTNNILYSNIGTNSLLSTVTTISNKQIGFNTNALIIGGNLSQNYLSINADSNNNLLRLTNNKSTTNCVDFNANGSSTHQVNIINNSSNKITNIVNHNGSTFGLRFNDVLLPVTANELNKLDSNPGTASPSKALIVDSSRNISNINNISVNKLIVNNNLILNSSDNNNSYLSSITPGTVSASKLMVLDSDKNIGTLNKITSDNIKINTVNSIEHSLNKDNFDLKNYYFGQTKNNMLNPSNLNMNNIVWSPELSMFVGVGVTWQGAQSDKTTNNYSINYSYDGINWQSAISFSHMSQKLFIAWSSSLSRFVVISEFQRVGYSTDGINWIGSNTTNTNTWTSLVWADTLNLFVAVSNTGTGNRVITSPDGITWTSRTSAANNNWTSLTWGNNTLVAVANSGTTNRVMTSTNGTTWTIRTTPNSNDWNAVTYGNGLFVAVSSTGTGNRVMTSSDGTTWTARTSAADNNWQTIIYANNLFIAGSNSGTNNRIMTSSNGTTWTIQNTTNANLDFKCFAYSPSLNITVAGSNGDGLSNSYAYNKIATSTDGTSWTLRDSIYDLSWDIIYVNELSLFIGVSSRGFNYHKQLAYSSDGYIWNYGFIDSTISATFKKICWSPTLSLLIATSNSNKFYKSTNGINWTSVNVPNSATWNCIIWINELSMFIAVGNTGQVTKSTDGDNWSAISMPSSRINTYIEWSSSLNLAIITTQSNPTIYFTSNDGNNWTERTMLADGITNINTNAESVITWISQLNLFMYFGPANVNSYYTSTDGLNWITRSTTVTTSRSANLEVMNITRPPVWINKFNKLYATYAGNTFSRIYESSDGITWNKYYVVNSLHDRYNNLCWANSIETLVFYGPNTYLAPIQPFMTLNTFNTPTINHNLSSVNNLVNSYSNSAAIDSISTWTSRTSAANNNWTSLCYSFDKNLFVAVSNTGSSNRVMASPDGITWTTRTSSVDNNWTSICYSQELGLFVVVANSGTGNRVMTSPDGTTWTSRTSAADNNWTSVCWSGDFGLFVAVANSGTGNRIMTSSNGTNWELRSNPIDNNWTSICWSPDLEIFVAVASSGTGNRVMTSYNGITWTTRASVTDNNWTSICWSLELGLFVAVANTGSGDRVMTSPNGITWTSRTSATDNNWTSVCWAPEINSFIAVASSGISNRIMTSFNGITWTSRTSPVDNDWTAICWSSGYNMAVTISNTGTTNHVLTSTISLPYPKSSYISHPSTLSINQSNGRVGLGTFSPNYQLELSTNSAAKPSTSFWSVSSDMRLKEDIEDANLDICYDNIKKLRLVKYAWKEEIINPNTYIESEEEPKTQLGWIANEVEEIFPKAVKTISAYNLDDCKTLDSDQIIASLFGASKKLLNEYEEQKNIIQSLNNELDTLQNYINQLDISLE